MRTRIVSLLLLVSLAAAACTQAAETVPTTAPRSPAPSPTTTVAQPTTTTTTAHAERVLDPDGFYLMLMYHHHQPLYPADQDGVVTRPWVRAHAAKDYYDMAALLGRYPDVRATINLTPVLLLQLEDIMNGTRDRYWVLSETPVAELTDQDKQFIRDRFFDTNRAVIARFPRYQEILAKAEAGRTFTEGDYRDLQMLWNLAWTDPSILAEDSIAALVAKQRGYTREEISTVLNRHLEIVSDVFDIHRRLWDQGQIEVTTTPLAHPILPLISDSEVARDGDPVAVLPAPSFREEADAIEHVERGLEEAERLLGRRPAGMWPGEGAVAQNVIDIFAGAGVQWIATGEDVLARTLDVSITRDSNGILEQPETLYRPYAAQTTTGRPLPMFFRDVALSDAVDFIYSDRSAEAAVDDFMARLRAAKQELEVTGVPGPKVVSVILDGENAWEHYANDGIDFLTGLYRALTDANFVETVTPTELIAAFPDAPVSLPDVFPAAWFSPNFGTWIGEPEEAAAWEYLATARRDLRSAENEGVGEEELAVAYESLLFAEGSDWFWWYGSDQESGDDQYFDAAYRELLGQMYDGLGLERPPYTRIPIVPAPLAPPARPPQDMAAVEIDNTISDAEWSTAGRYDLGGDPLAAMFYGFTEEHLNMRLAFTEEVLGLDNVGLDLYIDVPSAPSRYGLTTGGEVLGFNASHRLSWRSSDPLIVAWSPHGVADPADTLSLDAGFDGDDIEFALPLDDIGPLPRADAIRFRVVDVSTGPEVGMYPETPGYMETPDVATPTVAAFADPLGDDYGPGGFTYPTDEAFAPGSFDLVGFTVAKEANDMVFEFEIDAEIQNPWSAPLGFSVQAFDLYIDTDPGAATGAQLLLDGRNAALEDGAGWDYAITLEGWDPAFYVASADGTTQETNPTFATTVVPDQGVLRATIDRSLLAEGDPAAWGYIVAVLGQDGFAPPGIRRVREVGSLAEAFRFGGGSGAPNETWIIDLLAPEPGDQELLLSTIPVLSRPTDELEATHVARIPLLLAV